MFVYVYFYAGIVFDQLEGKSIEYTLRLTQPSDSWGTAGRGNTAQLGPRTSKYIYNVYTCNVLCTKTIVY